MGLICRSFSMDFLPFSRPSFGDEELAAVKAVFDSGWITTGAKCAELEQAFVQMTGNQYAIAVSSANQVQGRDPGHGRRDHLIARPDPHRHQRDMHSGSGRAYCDGVLVTGQLNKLNSMASQSLKTRLTPWAPLLIKNRSGSAVRRFSLSTPSKISPARKEGWW